MNETKPTAGPWEVDEGRDTNDQATVTGDGGWLVAVVPHGCLTSMEPVMEANARLIAAAPDLLEGLRDVLAWIDEVGAEAKRRDTERLAFARAAIAKAEGE